MLLHYLDLFILPIVNKEVNYLIAIQGGSGEWKKKLDVLY